MTNWGGEQIRAPSAGAAKNAIEILDSYGLVRARCLTLINLPFVMAFNKKDITIRNIYLTALVRN